MPEVFGYKLDLKNLGIGQAHEENIDFIKDSFNFLCNLLDFSFFLFRLFKAKHIIAYTLACYIILCTGTHREESRCNKI
jgi:hypothetical protein